LVSLSELLKEPIEEVRWLVDELLPRGGLSVLAGKPKAGKSTLARALALAVAQGKDFLGRSVAQGAVIYLALEEKRLELRRHFVAMGARDEDPIKLLVGPAPANIVTCLAAHAAEAKPALIVVDTMARFARVRDVNDYAQVVAALEPVLAIARETGAHVMLLHHAKKGEASADGDSILGSTAIFGSVDTALFLRRTESGRFLSSRQRYGTDLPEIVVALDQDTQTPLAAGSREECDLQDTRERILQFLQSTPGAVTEPEINEGVTGRRQAKMKAIRDLVETQVVKRSGGGRKGDPFRYSLPPPGAADSVPGSQVPDEKGN
jgi:hypothetical protein